MLAIAYLLEDGMSDLGSISMRELESHRMEEQVLASIEGEGRREREFRRLVSGIAQHLGDEEVKNIAWQEQLPQQTGKSPLDVLQYLYQCGKFKQHDARPLAQLLKDINREDLVGRVDAFMEQYGKFYLSSLQYC